jgi:hypothetical protein
MLALALPSSLSKRSSWYPRVQRGIPKMPPLEHYLENADTLAQEVVNTWGQVGNSAPLTTQFNALLDKACAYRNAKRLADNRREHNMLSEQDEAEEKATRQAFAEAYKAFYEKRAGMS